MPLLEPVPESPSYGVFDTAVRHYLHGGLFHCCCGHTTKKRVEIQQYKSTHTQNKTLRETLDAFKGRMDSISQRVEPINLQVTFLSQEASDLSLKMRVFHQEMNDFSLELDQTLRSMGKEEDREFGKRRGSGTEGSGRGVLLPRLSQLRGCLWE